MTELLERILRSQKQINEKLTKLLEKPQKQTWVSVRFITDLTGWDGVALFQARKQKIIQYRKNPNGGYEYLLESLPEQLIKKDISEK